MASVVLAVGLVGGVIGVYTVAETGVAGATNCGSGSCNAVAPSPGNGACAFYYAWGIYPNSMFNIEPMTYAPYYAQCGQRWDAGVTCGNISNPVQVWAHGPAPTTWWDTIVPPNDQWYGTGWNNACPSGTYITNFIIVVKIWGTLNTCWSENAHNWITGRSDLGISCNY